MNDIVKGIIATGIMILILWPSLSATAEQRPDHIETVENPILKFVDSKNLTATETTETTQNPEKTIRVKYPSEFVEYFRNNTLKSFVLKYKIGNNEIVTVSYTGISDKGVAINYEERFSYGKLTYKASGIKEIHQGGYELQIIWSADWFSIISFGVAWTLIVLLLWMIYIKELLH